MSSAFDKSVDAADALINTVRSTARRMSLQQKDIVSGVQSFGGISDMQDASRQKRRYAQFSEWLYSGFNAIGTEAAGQPGHLLRHTEATDEEDGAGKQPAAQSRVKAALLTKIRKRNKATAADDSEPVFGHEFNRLLMQPNPVQGWWQFVYSFVLNLGLTGWSYVIVDEVDGQTVLYSLPTTWVQPDHSQGPFKQFKIRDPANPSGKGEVLTDENVAFAYLPNPANPLGAIAPASSQESAIKIDNYIQSSREQFFENGVFPSVVVTVGKDPHPDVPGGVRPRLTGPQRRQVMSAIQKVMSGVANYGSPAIVDGLIEKIDRLSATSNEMGWDKSEVSTRTRILSAIGVHPYILGEPVSVGGYAQAAKIEERFCKRVNTYTSMLGEVLTKLARILHNDESLEVWVEPCEPHDPSLTSQNVREARKNEDITRNEFRAWLGWPPVEESQKRNKLLETVGGVAGAIQVLTALGQGVISGGQAKAIFMLFYQLSDAEAAQLSEAVSDAEQLVESVRGLQSAILSMKQVAV